MDKKEINSNVVTAYRCPNCQKTIFGRLGILNLFGDRIVLKCSECGESQLTATKTKDSKIRFDYPCVFCGSNHNVLIQTRTIMSRDLITMPCFLSGFDSLFIGKESNVVNAVFESDQAVSNYLSSIPQEEIEENKCDEETTDQTLVTMLITVLGDMETNKKIHCGCEKGKYVLTINDDNIDLRCQNCNKHLKIYTNFGNGIAYDILYRDEIYLHDDNAEEDE